MFRTSFDCANKNTQSMLADIDWCNIYHVCVGSRDNIFLCPPGTIFNDTKQGCMDRFDGTNCNGTRSYYKPSVKRQKRFDSILSENSSSKTILPLAFKRLASEQTQQVKQVCPAEMKGNWSCSFFRFSSTGKLLCHAHDTIAVNLSSFGLVTHRILACFPLLVLSNHLGVNK